MCCLAFDFIVAGEALAYFAAAVSWLAAWQTPAPARLRTAAFATALSFLLKGFRISLAIVADG